MTTLPPGVGGTAPWAAAGAVAALLTRPFSRSLPPTVSIVLVMLVMKTYAQLGYKRFAWEPFPRYFIFR